jgi:ABC-type transport system involved in Fe-S cluster assembly fused permease/ATPase subunit
MQELPESVKRMVGEVYAMLMKGDAHERRGVAREFGAFATKPQTLPGNLL